MSMQSIREQYGVPARRGREVRFRGERAFILSADRSDMHLYIEVGFPGPVARLKVHPTWQMDYLDGKGVR